MDDFGVDVAMALDECTPYPATRGRGEALDGADAPLGGAGTRRRSSRPRRGGASAQFGIVQGGMYPDLRAESAAAVAALGFEGIACGGVSVGEPKELMRASVEMTAPSSRTAGPAT